MEILLYYVLPNIALFGSIILFSKLIEFAYWQMILNYARES